MAVGVVSCDDQLRCAKSLAPGLIAANADINGLIKCNRDDIGQRIAQALNCTGNQPSAADVTATFNALLP